MGQIHKVTLEILRHGPSHNQVLSPLTQYLVLCGNHSPETFQLPWEHHEMMATLRTLRYEDSSPTLRIERRTLGRQLGRVLGQIKSLISELKPNDDSPYDQPNLTELRLVLSSEELALIPFELALTPEGCPGEGEEMVLQERAPLTITRQVRRVSNHRFPWPKEPRILFVTASPQGRIPTDAHMLALRRALAPWIPQFQDPASSQKIFDTMVDFLPRATWDSIAEACRRTDYSHVHILAHGMAIPDGEGIQRFGLALHQGSGMAADPVDGKRLADALRVFRDGSQGRQSCPAVVTLATCDGGNAGPLGGVLDCGSSLAHTLHEAGVPLVLASQFPLSFKGSAIFAEMVYEDLLRGTDPRLLMVKLRRRLHGAVPDRHDWASLVFYCAWPEDLELQLRGYRLHAANRSTWVALDWADQLTSSSPRDSPEKARARIQSEKQAALKMAQGAIDWLNELCRDPWNRRASTDEQNDYLGGLLASAEKRLAEVRFKASGDLYPDETILAPLRRSRDYYRQLYEEDPPKSWALVQFLVLEVALCKLTALHQAAGMTGQSTQGKLPNPEQFLDLWSTAYGMASLEAEYRSGRPQAWAYASLIELHLLIVVLANEITKLKDQAKGAEAKAIGYSVELAGRDKEWRMTVYSTRRQIKRYQHLFQMTGDQEIQRVVDKLLDLLPESRPDER